MEGPLHSRARWASGQLSKPGLNLPVRPQGEPQLRGRALLRGVPQSTNQPPFPSKFQTGYEVEEPEFQTEL